MEAKETTNEKNEEQKAPILVMTLEIEEGNTKQIKLYSDSNSGEVAFSFCKENNLDYEYLTHLKEQIDLLLAQQKKEESNKPIEDKNINKGNEPSLKHKLEKAVSAKLIDMYKGFI